MKSSLLSLSCLVALAFDIHSASADPVTVYLTGHVLTVSDSNGNLGGQVTVGQAVTVQYRYDTNVTDTNSDPRYGEYPQGPRGGSTRLSVGSLVFQTDPTLPGWHYEVTVHPSDLPGSYQSFLTIDSAGNRLFPNGTAVD